MTRADEDGAEGELLRRVLSTLLREDAYGLRSRAQAVRRPDGDWLRVSLGRAGGWALLPVGPEGFQCEIQVRRPLLEYEPPGPVPAREATASGLGGPRPASGDAQPPSGGEVPGAPGPGSVPAVPGGVPAARGNDSRGAGQALPPGGGTPVAAPVPGGPYPAPGRLASGGAPGAYAPAGEDGPGVGPGRAGPAQEAAAAGPGGPAAA
ncbi:hypothetical protein RKE29_20520, partial [Streptomyces sp. B1866]|nr:hypothetical protein [Streptomyces sp. B1866]